MLEQAVYQMLCDLDLCFDEQKRIGFYPCDFVLDEHRLVIEADGEYWHSLPHNQRRDCRKDKFLHKRGFEVLRLAETDIEMRPEWCKFEIIRHLR